jgi:hypothetical protein
MHQIILRTPLWVWAPLAFLIYRGLLASVNRETTLKKVFIIPVVMLGLSLQGIFTTFPGSEAALASWAGFMLAGGWLSWQFFDRKSVVADPQRGVVLQQGSWIPLTLMMGIFFTKYAVNVALAIIPGFKQEMLFVTAVCALYGVFNGVFIGKLLRIVVAYREAAGFGSLEPVLVKQANML